MSTLQQKELDVVTSKARVDKPISSLKGILQMSYQKILA
jgi:hypothetical protein